MLNEHDIQTAIEILTIAKNKAKMHCDSWRDSGDRGACYVYKVKPVENVLDFFEQLKEDLKADSVKGS